MRSRIVGVPSGAMLSQLEGCYEIGGRCLLSLLHQEGTTDLSGFVIGTAFWS
jgi:hypothetical protein